jgi:hypothetical protein
LIIAVSRWMGFQCAALPIPAKPGCDQENRRNSKGAIALRIDAAIRGGKKKHATEELDRPNSS